MVHNSTIHLEVRTMTSPLFDNAVYDPTQDPTTSNWNGSGPGGAQTAYDLAERQIAHGIDQSGGVAAFASVRAPAWHGLGTVLDHPASAEELLTAAHADYDVIKVPDFAHIETPILMADGNTYTTSDGTALTLTKRIEDQAKRKLVRQHPVTKEWQVLGTCGPNYQPLTNREAFIGFGDALIDVAEPNAATCGVLFDGKRAFMCWKLPKGILVGGVDAIELWLLVDTSHDLSTPLRASITPLRTVCQNTCRWNLANAVSRWSVKHTRNAKLNLTEARTSLKLSYEYTSIWEQIGEQLLQTSLTNQKFDEIIAKNWGPGDDAGKKALDTWDEKRGKLMNLFAQADTQANVRGTAWAALQAVGEYCDWETKVNENALGSDWSNPTGYRFWRSLAGEKSVQIPKQASLRIFADFAGVNLDKIEKRELISA